MAGKSGGGMVIARTGAKRVQSIVPNQREWLSVLVCVNAAGTAIPSFYIFRGKRFRQNYIQHCEAGATMAMQPRAWMTSYLFSAWISHFVASIQRTIGISPTQRHLLVLDGHNSHVTLEVARAAKNVGLDLISLPSHTSHALQPLDVAVFKPFKQFFREYRDFWMSRNINQPANKETLAQWVSLSLRKALTESNIRGGFRGAGIYPLNFHAVDSYLVPSETYGSEGQATNTSATNSAEGGLHREGAADAPSSNAGGGEGDNTEAYDGAGLNNSEHEDSDGEGQTALPEHPQLRDLAGDFDRQPDEQTEHFFVHVDPSEEAAVAEEVAGLDPDVSQPESITQFLQLPTFAPRANSRRRDPIVDFAKSIILTSHAYEEAAVGVITAREAAAQQKEQQKQDREEARKRKAQEREESNTRKAAEKEESLRLKQQRAQEKATAMAQKAAEREAAAAAKAARAYEVAMARAEKAAERGRRRTPRCGPGATQTVEGHRPGDGVGGNSGAPRAAEQGSIGIQGHYHPGMEQLGAYMHSLRGASFSQADNLHGASFSPAESLHSASFSQAGTQQLPPHFFFPSSSSLPPLPHFDNHPQSTRPLSQYSVPFQVSHIPGQPWCIPGAPATQRRDSEE